METERASQRTLGTKIKDHIGWWLGAAAAIAGIVAVYFAINPPPPPGPTMSEWQIAAQSACSAHGGPAITKFDRARKAMQELADDANAGNTPDQSAVTDAGQQYEDAGNAISAFVGQLRGIEQPADHASQINEALDLGDDIGSTMANAGRAVRDRQTEAARNGFVFIEANDGVWREKMAALKACRGNISPTP